MPDIVVSLLIRPRTPTGTTLWATDKVAELLLDESIITDVRDLSESGCHTGDRNMEQKRMKDLKAKARQAEIADDAFGETEQGRALDVRMEFARSIIALLKSQKITQAELCRRIAMKPAQMSRIVNAEENVTLPTIRRIADGFGVPMARLFRKPRETAETK